MAKNKKKIRKYNHDKALDQAKSLIRKSKDPEVGVSELKMSYSAEELTRIIPKLLTQPAFNVIITNKPFPKSFGSTGVFRYSPSASAEIEIVWLCGIFKNFAEQIQFYLSTVSKLESEYLMGKRVECDQFIDLIKNKLGVSLSVFERELQIAYHFGNYSEKDTLQKTVRAAVRNSFLRYSLVWPNLRIDRTMRPEEFSRLIDQSLPRGHYVNSLFLLLQGQLKKPDEIEAAAILAMSHVYPLIDRYEIFINLLLEIISSNSFVLSQESIKCVRYLEQNIYDPRLKKLLIALEIKPQNNSNKLEDSAATLSMQTLNQIAMAGQSSEPPSEKEVSGKSSQHTSLLEEIHFNLRDINSYSEKGVTARNTLFNLCSIHFNQGWSSNLRMWLEHQLHNTFIFPPRPIQILSALKATGDTPLFAFSFPTEKSKDIYVNSFRETGDQADLIGLYDDVCSDTSNKIPHLSLPIFEVARHLKNGREQEAKNILCQREGASSLSSQQGDISTVWVNYLLRNGDLKLATFEASRSILRSGFFASVLPLEDIATKLKVENYKPMVGHSTRGQIATAIIFDVYSRTFSTKFDVEKADSYKDVLALNGVEKASELKIENPNYSTKELYSFLKNVCISDVLDQSLVFENTTDVENERVAILVKLNDLKDTFESYDDTGIKKELTEISTRQVIRQTAIQLEQSKIYVNIEGIRRQLESKLQDTWKRFKLITYDEFEKSDDELKDFISKNFGGQLQLLFLNQPITERRKLLENIIQAILSEFTGNKEFGLNSNLSANIRHGYVLRELRNPFVQNRLVTNKNTDSGVYQENSFLIDGASNLNIGEKDFLKVQLNDFSAQIDGEIEQLTKNLLRIQTKDFPEGLFKYIVPKNVVDRLYNDAEEIEELDKFSNLVYDFLWNLTENNLNAVRQTLSQAVAPRLTGALDTLRDTLETKNLVQKVPTLNNNLVNAKSELRHSIQSVSSWFTLSKIAEYEDYNIKIAFEAGLRTIQTYFIDTNIVVDFTGDNPKLAGQTLPFFSRLFFLLLDNAGTHGAEQGADLKIEVTSEQDGSQLMLKVKNSLRKDRDEEKIEKAIEKISQEYGKSPGLDLIGEDSGSGFAKIWNLLRNDLNLEHDLAVHLEKDEFVVEILIEAIQLR